MAFIRISALMCIYIYICIDSWIGMWLEVEFKAVALKHGPLLSSRPTHIYREESIGRAYWICM
jgi:hypothetical protein